MMQGSIFITTWNFVRSSYSTVFRLAFALLIQYLLLCSTFAILYDGVRHQQRLDYIHLIPKLRLWYLRNWLLSLNLLKLFCIEPYIIA